MYIDYREEIYLYVSLILFFLPVLIYMEFYLYSNKCLCIRSNCNYLYLPINIFLVLVHILASLVAQLVYLVASKLGFEHLVQVTYFNWIFSVSDDYTLARRHDRMPVQLIQSYCILKSHVTKLLYTNYDEHKDNARQQPRLSFIELGSFLQANYRDKVHLHAISITETTDGEINQIRICMLKLTTNSSFMLKCHKT